MTPARKRILELIILCTVTMCKDTPPPESKGDPAKAAADGTLCNFVDAPFKDGTISFYEGNVADNFRKILGTPQSDVSVPVPERSTDGKPMLIRTVTFSGATVTILLIPENSKQIVRTITLNPRSVALNLNLQSMTTQNEIVGLFGTPMETNPSELVHVCQQGIAPAKVTTRFQNGTLSSLLIDLSL